MKWTRFFAAIGFLGFFCQPALAQPVLTDYDKGFLLASEIGIHAILESSKQAQGPNLQALHERHRTAYQEALSDYAHSLSIGVASQFELFPVVMNQSYVEWFERTTQSFARKEKPILATLDLIHGVMDGIEGVLRIYSVPAKEMISGSLVLDSHEFQTVHQLTRELTRVFYLGILHLNERMQYGDKTNAGPKKVLNILATHVGKAGMTDLDLLQKLKDPSQSGSALSNQCTALIEVQAAFNSGHRRARDWRRPGDCRIKAFGRLRAS